MKIFQGNAALEFFHYPEVFKMHIFIGAFCRINKAVTIFILAMMATSAWSACAIVDTSDGSGYYKYVFSNFNPPEFNPTVAKNTVIYSRSAVAVLSNGVGDRLMNCSSEVMGYSVGKSTPVNNIYPTTVEGIGMRVSTIHGAAPVSTSKYSNHPGSFAYQLSDVKVELIKTADGDITAGGVLDSDFLYERANDAFGQLLAQYNFSSPVVLRPKVPTCTPQAPEPVRMAQTVTQKLTSIGSTGAPRSFLISLLCKGGIPGSLTNAYVTLTDVANPGNIGNVLTLSKTSVAKGVGVQIRKGEQILGFGPDSNAAGNRNQWFAGAVAYGQARLDIPLTARYVKTGENVTIGSANAAATFTISYQ
ncbi:fimbrial protein [Delftia acidovorans]|uniref:fimbrial protein n=1 Tax=Delftia acidovorans TaxID=80866 RepID=UPI00192C052D|nr:fimbrial protein [Delftia acidovorans]